MERRARGFLICKTCQEQKTEELPALGHGWDNGWFTTPPTCQEDGERTYTCGVCHATKTEVVKASEEYHNFYNLHLFIDSTLKIRTLA